MPAMYKTRNTGTGNAGMGEMLYTGECRQIFRGISPNIPGNVVKHPGNVAKHSGECSRTFRVMLSNIPGNVLFTLMVENWSKFHT